METAAAARGGAVPVQPSRKEWRAVSESPFRSNSGEEAERGRMGQTDERTIYEEGAGPPEVDFCSISMDVNGDILQQRIQDIARQRMEFEAMEIGMKAQVIAKSAIMDMQRKCEERVKEHADAASKLKEQMQQKELHIRELEMKLEDKERELRALQLDTEAAWAKEDLLREQNKELATFRRERDNSEAERAHHIKQIHDLKQHLQEKEAQALEFQEQHRVAQETIIYKDEQLREAQAWVARAQEMDALQSTTNQSLQAELRERTEQFNQYWGLLIRQYAEMERHLLQTVQQLQLELNEMREQSGLRKANNDQQAVSNNSKHPSSQSNGGQFIGSENDIATVISMSSSSGDVKNEPSVVLTSNVQTKQKHAAGMSIVPSPLVGMGGYGQPSQINTLQPFVMHLQGVPPPVLTNDSQFLQPQFGNFLTVTGNSTVQTGQTQQVLPENSEMSNHNHNQLPGADHVVQESVTYNYEQSDTSNLVAESKHVSCAKDVGSNEYLDLVNDKALNSSGQKYLSTEEPAGPKIVDSQHLSSVSLKLPEQSSDKKFQDEIPPGSQEPRVYVSESEQLYPARNSTPSTPRAFSASASDASEGHIPTANIPEVALSAVGIANSFSPSISPSKSSPSLLDEKSLLACIVRAIPMGPNGSIRISTTLPNRLGKMLAPFHWHDYRKQYGKLDDFVSRHPELFVIEGDFIHLREGAQEIVSANSAAARFAAAASASASHSSHPVALTPIAQGHRQKWYQSADVKYAGIQTTGNSLLAIPGEGGNKVPQHLVVQNQQLITGGGFDVLQGIADMKIMNQTRSSQGMDLPSDLNSNHSSDYLVASNGVRVDSVGLPSSQIKVIGRGKNGPIGRNHGRTSSNVVAPRR